MTSLHQPAALTSACWRGPRTHARATTYFLEIKAADSLSGAGPPRQYVTQRNISQGRGKVPKDSVVVSDESPRHRGSSRTKVPVPRLKSLKFSRTLHSADTTQYDNYDYDAPESRWRLKKTRNFGYESHKRRNTDCCTYLLYTFGVLIRCNADLHELFEKIFCIPVTSAPVELVLSTSGQSMQPHSASNIRPQPML